MSRISYIKQALVLFTTGLMVWACVETEQVSPIPEIHYKSMVFGSYGNSGLGNSVKYGIIEFSFIDGDADLGVYDAIHNDSTLPDSMRNGIFVSFFEKVDGQYYERFFTETKTIQIRDSVTIGGSVIVTIRDSVITDTLSFNYLLPYDSKMDRVGQNKIIKGIIRDTIHFPPMNLPFDTMRFEFYIRDRALHKSNVEVTDDFTNPDFNPSSGQL